MKVSLNWAQYYSNVDLKSIPREELLQKIGAQLGAVEEVIDWGPRYDGIFVVKVVSCDPHPNADKLHICKVDDGGAVKDAERDDNGLVQVVCGAANVHAGMFAAWVPPGAVVPSTIDKDPFVLTARELRGVVSNGMLASSAELGISDDHGGLLEITTEDVSEALIVPGTPFKQLYGMDDLIIDCENKMFTHRPDCFGILGVAREFAGITHQKFISPDWYLNAPVTTGRRRGINDDLELNVSVAADLVPRFMAQVISGITIKPGPIYMQAGLSRIGMRPINNIVDISNCFMQWTAQPTHAFDYDKIKALSGGVATLGPRMAVEGEELTLLNGKTIKLSKNDIVIATDKKAVALAGIMGGADTEVDDSTKNIIIECATFDMYAVRRSAMRHGVFSDAVTRFNKGQSPLQNDRILAEVVKDILKYAGGEEASDVFDIKADSVKPMPVISAHIDFINTRLGSNLSVDQVQSLLGNVECYAGANSAQESRSFLKGAGDIDDKLTRVGIKIVSKTEAGDYRLLIPAGTEAEYEKLVAWEMKPGLWTEYIGGKNVFLFKDANTKVTRYEATDDNEHEIVEMCRTFASDYYTSLEAMLALNEWYKPVLPLKKASVETRDPDTVTIAPPFWRRDLELPEDLVEEIGRLYGFDKLPVTLPARSAAPAKKDAPLELAAKIRSILATAGANEVLTYSFVHGDLFEKVGQNKDLAFHIRNALSPDLQYYRLSLTPNLLDKVNMNIRAGFDHFALFEIGRTHNKVHTYEAGEVPEETGMLALTLATSSKSVAKGTGAAFYDAKVLLDYLAAELDIPLIYIPITEMPDYPVAKPFEPSRSAFVSVVGSKVILGIIGEYRASVVKALKLPLHSAGFELGTTELEQAMGTKKIYKVLSKFPGSQQDATFEVSAAIRFSDLQASVVTGIAVQQAEHGYQCTLEPGDIFIPEAGDKKRYTFHFYVSHLERTLTTEEVNKFLTEVSKQAAADCAAKRI